MSLSLSLMLELELEACKMCEQYSFSEGSGCSENNRICYIGKLARVSSALLCSKDERRI